MKKSALFLIDLLIFFGFAVLIAALVLAASEAGSGITWFRLLRLFLSLSQIILVIAAAVLLKKLAILSRPEKAPLFRRKNR